MLQRYPSILFAFSLLLLVPSAGICQNKSDLIRKGEQLYYDGKDLYYEGQYKLARAKYNETLKIYEENLEAPHELLFKIYHRSLRNETQLRNFAKAKEYGEKALYNAKSVFGEFSEESATIYTAFGLLSYKERRILDAIAHCDKAIEISSKLHGLESRHTANVIMNNANNYSEKGDLNKAIEMAEFALKVFEKTLRKDHENFNRVYLNLSSMYRDQRDLEKALAYGEKALEIKLKNYKETHPSVSKYFANMGKILASLKRFKESEKYFNKSLEISKLSYGYYSPAVGHGINDMARIFLKEDNLEKAKQAYLESIKVLSRTNESQRRLSAPLVNLAVVEYDLGKKDEAIDRILQVNKDLKLNDGDNQLDLTENYTLLASMYRHNDDLENAAVAIQNASKHFMQMDASDENSFHKLALERQKSKLLLQKGGLENFLDAKLRIDQSITTLTTLRKSYLGSSSKSKINEYLADNFELAVEVGLKLYEIDPNDKNLDFLYSTIERAKAASFWDSDSEKDAYNYGGASAAIIGDIEYVKSNISETQQDLRVTQDLPTQKILKDSLFQDKRRLEELFNKIEVEFPKYYKLKYTLREHNIKELQRVLPEEMAVLDYFLLDGESLCIYVTKNGAGLFTHQIDSICEPLLVRKKKRFSAEENANLFETFFAEINGQLQEEEITRVAIVPHESLHFLSFDQLKSPLTGDFLVKNYAFSYQMRSEDVFNDLQVESSNSYLGFAPQWNSSTSSNDIENMSRDMLFSLPGTLKEVKQSSDLLKGEIYLNEEAKEAIFKANASQYDILHFATHAYLDPENDANSCLYMNEMNEEKNLNGEDGKLYANEIADLKLSAELVILSACNTGNGKISSGEGVMSLSRAFKFAGANSILMSLWLSNDQSSVPIITEFVANLKKGLPKDVALQQAKLKFLKSADPLMKDEYYWAGFMVNGELSPILKQRTSIYYFFLPILFIIFALWYRSRLVSKKVA